MKTRGKRVSETIRKGRRKKPVPPELVIASNPDTLCDRCGEPQGTLYRAGGGLVCRNELPFAYRRGWKRHRLVRYAVSGMKAIKKERSRLRKLATKTNKRRKKDN